MPAQDIIGMTFEELKAFEKKASSFLTLNKSLKDTHPNQWSALMKRYRQIVIVLNMKCERRINEDILKSKQLLQRRER